MPDNADSVNKLPVYAIVILVLVVLIILCGAIGIVYFIGIKRGRNSYPNPTVEMNNSVTPQEPVAETNGSESAVYDDTDTPSNYQALYTEMDQPVMQTEIMNNTTQYEDVSNITQMTEGPYYVNTNVSLN